MFRKTSFYVLLLLLSFFRGYSQTPSNIMSGQLILQLKPESNMNEFEASLRQISFPVTGIRTLSASMKIYLLLFDVLKSGNKVSLDLMQHHPAVMIAQYNHTITQRIIPNDPQFSNQWNMNNTGQNGGTVDADVDGPEAWNITTGGLTTQGDTIVVAVIDGGFDLAHEDIDFFVNRNEIPNNSIDDDNNGYVDDYRGWDALTATGAVSTSGSHGTHVSGIAGAKGNNNKGVTGVNMNVKILPVSGSSGNEAVVVAAYAYVRDMRLLYNATLGAKGAFIVSTNSSFGVDGGQPADFPIWCAMYDSMGYVGIISAGATANNNVDVDMIGDIPTACASNFLITITNTDKLDHKNNSAGYGLNTIDIGAPGTGITSSVPNNQYQSMTGTSMATPHVAGAVALVVAAACNNLITDYKANPAQVSLLFKNFILTGVDSITALSGNTVSKGRLNLHKAVLNTQNFCGNGCLPPYGLSSIGLTDTTTYFEWANGLSADSFRVEWRAIGNPVWNQFTDLNYWQTVNGFSGCLPYEYRVLARCGIDSSAWSVSFPFTSEGCCVPPSVTTVISRTDSDAVLIWNHVYAANTYSFQHRKSGNTSWTTTNTVTDTLRIGSLLPCSWYEYRLASSCDSGMGNYSVIDSFRTRGCGACLDSSYCAVHLSSDTYIDQIMIGQFSNLSGDNSGYEDFTDLPNTLHVSTTYSLSLSQGFFFFPVANTWYIWMDLNQNGILNDPGELIYTATPGAVATVNGQLSIPLTALDGFTRMRISMNDQAGANPCTSGVSGETEDYCITIDHLVETEPDVQNTFRFSVYPNPARTWLFTESDMQIRKLTIINLLGENVISLEALPPGKNEISISALSRGIYILFAESASGEKAIQKILVRN